MRTVLQVYQDGRTLSQEVDDGMPLGEFIEQMEMEYDKFGVIVRKFKLVSPADSESAIYEEYEWDFKKLVDAEGKDISSREFIERLYERFLLS